MKHVKKLASLLLAMVMVFAMTATVFAVGEEGGAGSTPSTGTYKLTINNTKKGHTYQVYQIFTGDISGTASKYVLSNVKYGANYGENVAVGDLVPEEILKEITDADDYAKSYVPYGEPKEVHSSDGSTIISGLEPGYYFVKDKEKVNGQDATTKFILQVVGDTSVNVKSDIPTVQKKVQENIKEVTGNTDARVPSYELDTKYNDVADYNIGDTVPFELVGTLPSNLSDYKTYKYIFHDTLSSGLSYVDGSVSVYLDSVSDATKIDSQKYSVTHDNGSLTISFANVVGDTGITGVSANSKIIVRYNATLNSGAVIGLGGNTNEVYLEFSNNPNQGGEGDTGTTPKDEVIVFTYELDVTKIDGAELADGEQVKTLSGAKFKLKNSENKWAVVEENKVKEWVADEADGTELVSDANGLFKVIGLDDGTYHLKETEAPEGYNKLTSEIPLVIKASTANNQTWSGTASDALTALKINVDSAAQDADGDHQSGIVNATVKNNVGATLPSTGGIGTTIFYVLGGILVVAAAILLVTKKRMSAEK